MPKESRQPSVLLRGRVTSFNISPKGHLEGVLVAGADGTVQINFAKDAEEDAERWREGAKIAVRAVLEEKERAHPVYQLVREEQTVRGRVSRLNYARHGEVNGFVLDEGTFIHLKPAGARKYPVRIGEEITVQGERRVGPAAVVIDATEVTRSSPAKRKPKEARADA